MSTVFIWLLAAMAVLGSYLSLRTGSGVRAGVGLLGSWLGSAGLMLALGAEYLFAVTVLLATSQVLVLLLFLVAFNADPGGLRSPRVLHQPRLAAAAGLTVFALLALTILNTRFPVPLRWAPPEPAVALGQELLARGLLIVQTVAALVLVTVVASVMLVARRGRFGEAVRLPRRPGEVVRTSPRRYGTGGQ